MNSVSILILSQNRLGQLNKCLSHLKKSLSLVDIDYEIVLGINGLDSRSYKLGYSYKKDLNIFIYQTDRNLVPSEGRNRLIPFCKKEWVYFIDDDAFVPEHFFQNVIAERECFRGVSVIGGPNLNPLNSNFFQVASGSLMTSRLASLMSVSRYKSSGSVRFCGEESLILCNLFIRRSALNQVDFDEDLKCAEENLLLIDLKLKGHRMKYIPTLFVWHERRPELVSFLRQVFKYGFGRGQLIKYKPRSFSFFYFIPTIFTLYLLALLTMFTLGHPWAAFFSVPAFVYLALCFGAAFRVWKRSPESCSPLLAPLCFSLFPVLHFNYGLGLLCGLFKGSRYV